MEKLIRRIGIPFIVVIVLSLLFAANSFHNIPAGQAGVVFETLGQGVVTDEPPLGEGLNIVLPWNRVVKYVVRQSTDTEKLDALSSNGLEIQVEATVWFRPVIKSLGKLHQEKGTDYKNQILLPALKSAARSVVGRYTPEQLYASKRDIVQQEIFDETKKIVESQYILLEKVLIRDVVLPTTITEAIERKLKQEQESLEYEFRLESARKEADKVRIDAQGKADANRILNSSLTTNILKDKGIEATIKLAESNNSKVIVIGSGESGLPLILGGNN
ncbi:prohibitin family protein [Flavobacteriaceae bacterium]|nr:prohibitin family protein [Flavobacteriaceae bacterium]